MTAKQQTQAKLLNNIMAKVDEFPTLPTVYSNLVDAIANPRCNAGDVAKVISNDQSSSTKILKISNSAIYGFVAKVSSINQAVVSIGFKEIRSLVLALSVIKMFEESKDIEAIKPVDLWQFSFAVGSISRNLAKACGVKMVEDYFVAGIVHGIGKLLFLNFMPDIYNKIILYSRQNNLPLHQVERATFGISHAGIGKMLGEKWKLPRELITTLGNYYNGMVDGRFDLMTAIVHISVVSATMYRFGNPGNMLVPRLNQKLWKSMSLPDDFFSKNYPIFLKEYDEMSGMLLK
jgi:HD-like signal output (HDOD) protein